MTGGIIVLGGLDHGSYNLIDETRPETAKVLRILSPLNAHVVRSHLRYKAKPFIVHTAAIRQAAKLADAGKVAVITQSWVDDLMDATTEVELNRWAVWSRILDRMICRYAGVYLFSPEGIHAAESSFPAFLNRPDVIFPAAGDGLVTTMAQLKLWRGLQYQPALSRSTLNVNGHIDQAEFFLIGDEINPIFAHVKHPPFFDPGGSAYYITEAMQKHNHMELKFIWSNANHKDPAEQAHIKGILNQKAGLKVIALGKKASATLKRMDVPIYAEIAHPQFARRFQHRGNYADQLNELVSDS